MRFSNGDRDEYGVLKRGAFVIPDQKSQGRSRAYEQMLSRTRVFRRRLSCLLEHSRKETLMATGPESKIRDSIVRLFRNMIADNDYIWWYKAPGGPMGAAGTPDFLICYRSRFIGIEVKVPGKDATPIQQENIRKIHRADGFAIVCRSAEEVRQFLLRMECPL